MIAKESKYFWWFVIAHCVIWTVVPMMMRYALPHDTIEGALWGQQIEWGYDKNPWMNAWLTRLGWIIGGQSGLGIYALSSLFVGISFWSVWKLARYFVSPLQAVLSALILETCINYTIIPQEFNDNVIELGLWPLLFLFFYKALKNQKNIYWLGVGVVAGLAMMAKYYTGIPLLIMLGYVCWDKEARECFKKPGLYIAFFSFLIIILPNMLWLYQHDFITLKYAFNRADVGVSAWILHFYYPISFFFLQLVNFSVGIIVLLFFKSRLNYPDRFLNWMALGPFLLTIVLAMLFGWHLYTEWGMPLASLWGLWLISFFNIKIDWPKFKIIMRVLIILLILWPMAYISGLFLQTVHKHSDNYPAQAIANYVTQEWHDKYHTPLKYVAGSRYIGGYIAFYAKDHPSVLVEWNPEYSQWIDMKKFKKYGAVFVQDNYYGTLVFGQHPDTHNGLVFPSAVLKKYPTLIILPVKYFQWHRDKRLAPIPVLIGFLPPHPQKIQ